MTWGNAVRCLSVGFLFGIFAIGLLPFLVILGWADFFNVVELEASPIFLFMGKFIGKPNSTAKRKKVEEKRVEEKVKLEP